MPYTTKYSNDGELYICAMHKQLKVSEQDLTEKYHKEFKMSNDDQKNLDEAVTKLVSEFGKTRAIEIIKAKPSKGLFGTRQHYLKGVFIYCDSAKGGTLLGKRK